MNKQRRDFPSRKMLCVGCKGEIPFGDVYTFTAHGNYHTQCWLTIANNPAGRQWLIEQAGNE